jgi:hypothetical protein
VGQEHGIYVVTSRSMNKLRWDPHEQSLRPVWSTPYVDATDDLLKVRLSL